MARRFVLGDCHGNYKALLQCLEKSGFDKENDQLISLGDIADGWHEVPECVEELLTIKNLIAIRGNHDCWAWNYFEFSQTPDSWLTQGGEATLNAYLEQGLENDPRHRAFWNGQDDYYIDDENRLFVHGGFDLTFGFNYSRHRLVGIPNSVDLHWNRDCAFFNTKSWKKWSIKLLDEFNEIYIGHTAHNTTKFNYKEKHNIWNLDTGAGYFGKLTIMDVDTKEFWQSDGGRKLYPIESKKRKRK